MRAKVSIELDVPYTEHPDRLPSINYLTPEESQIVLVILRQNEARWRARLERIEANAAE